MIIAQYGYADPPGRQQGSRRSRRAAATEDATSEGTAGLRSVALRDQMEARCRDYLKQLGPDGAIGWLLTAGAHAVFGAKRCWDMARGLSERRDSVESISVSAAWVEAWDERGDVQPYDDVEHQSRRRHSAKLVLSAGMTADGDGRPTRRWTPPQAVAEEDRFDMLTEAEATFLNLPMSCSAAYIHRWRARNASADFDRLRECVQFTPRKNRSPAY